MSTQQDIYAAGSENRPPMLNKENYVPWSSRLLRYAKSRPNGKLIYNSIMNGPYVRRMIPEPGDTDREVPVPATFHEQTDDELTVAEIKQMEADDQAIQTILLGLPEDIYAAVDSCETAQEIWLRVQQMMKGSDIGIQEKKAKLFNEWERFTSTDGESIESYYHRFSKLMNDFKRNKHFPEKIASNLKFLNNLQPEWSRHVTIVHQTKDLHTTDYTQLYDFLKYNQKEVDDQRAERLAKTHDPLALMANSNNPFNYPVFHQDQPSPSTYMQQPQPINNNYNPQPSFNQNYMQQPMPNPEDITDPTTAMNMALALMAKAFKLNYSTPTNNNQRISSNPRNRQIAQPGMNMGQDRQMRMVGANGGNQFRQYAEQNVGYQNGYNAVQNVGNQVVQDAVQNQNGQIGVQNIGNGNVVAARAEGNTPGNNDSVVDCSKGRSRIHSSGRVDLMAAAADLDEIEEVNANCILMANLQQASTSGTQTDNAPSMIQTDQLSCILSNSKPIPEPHQEQQNDSNVISDFSSVEQEGGTVDQHPATVEETRAYFESLYNNLALEVEKVNSVNQKMKETNADLTTELARYKNQEKCFEISQEKYDKLERCYQKSVYQEQCLTKKINALHLSSGKQITTLNEEISNLSKQLSTEKSTVSSLLEEKKKLKSDFKIREDELLDKQIQLENKIKELDNILVKTGQSIQTMHMLSPKPDSFYHTEQKMALGYQNPFYLKQAQRKHQCLYDGKVLLEKHDPPVVHDSEETLQLAQESRQKMKQLNKEIKPANYTKINHLSGVFEKDHLYSACQLGKSQKHTHTPKTENTNMKVLNTLHMDLCGPMRVQTINGKKYILVIIDDYFRFTWVKFLRSKDDTPEFVINFLKQIQVGLNKTVRYIHTDNGTESVNQILTKYYESVEAAMTMLIFSKASMFLWAEAVATACYTQNFFGALCYPTNDSEDLRKLQPTADIIIFVGYAPSRKGYRIYNKRTRKIIETIHVQFDELSEPMAPVQLSSGPAPSFLMPGQIKPPRVERPVSPAPAVLVLVNSASTPSSTTIDQDAPSLSHSPSSSALQSPSSHQRVAAGSTILEDNPFAPVDNNPLVNVFTPEPSSEASSSGDVYSTESTHVSQPHHHLRKWSKDHPLDNVIGNPSRPVSTRKQLATDALWCLYNSVLSKVEPKNFKFAITEEDCWVSMAMGGAR
ncbi:retrovirus-related pol polyprotein from transposon TNT 1-94 [Tanacetum coccineum]